MEWWRVRGEGGVGSDGGEREWSGGGREWSGVMEEGGVMEGVVWCDGGWNGVRCFPACS